MSAVNEQLASAPSTPYPAVIESPRISSLCTNGEGDSTIDAAGSNPRNWTAPWNASARR